jgi:hypothetical protein
MPPSLRCAAADYADMLPVSAAAMPIRAISLAAASVMPRYAAAISPLRHTLPARYASSSRHFTRRYAMPPCEAPLPPPRAPRAECLRHFIATFISSIIPALRRRYAAVARRAADDRMMRRRYVALRAARQRAAAARSREPTPSAYYAPYSSPAMPDAVPPPPPPRY